VSTGKALPRRVLIIVENLSVPFDRRVWNEATTLQAAGYDVSVICPMGSSATARHEVLQGIHIYRHPLPEARYACSYIFEYLVALFWETVLTWRLFLTRGFDVIHACNPPDLIFLIGGFFKIFFRKKFIFDHHDISPELFEAKFGRRGLYYRLLLVLERLSFLTSDISIATNNSYRRIALERGRMDPERVFVVRSGPNLDRLTIMPPDQALKHGRKYLVVYVGVMGVQEGIPYLLHAVRRIVLDIGSKDVHFRLMGSGPELGAMKVLAEELGITSFVTFTGRVSEEELVRTLNTADVCVNPDECNAMNDKSTMNKVMEYMAVGKPIVQFDMTEGRVSAAEASLYAKCNDSVDFADKILELLSDAERRRIMGEAGRRRICDMFAWPHEAMKLLAAYETVFAEKKPAPQRPNQTPRPM